MHMPAPPHGTQDMCVYAPLHTDREHVCVHTPPHGTENTCVHASPHGQRTCMCTRSSTRTEDMCVYTPLHTDRGHACVHAPPQGQRTCLCTRSSTRTEDMCVYMPLHMRQRTCVCTRPPTRTEDVCVHAPPHGTEDVCVHAPPHGQRTCVCTCPSTWDRGHVCGRAPPHRGHVCTHPSTWDRGRVCTRPSTRTEDVCTCPSTWGRGHVCVRAPPHRGHVCTCPSTWDRGHVCTCSSMWDRGHACAHTPPCGTGGGRAGGCYGACGALRAQRPPRRHDPGGDACSSSRYRLPPAAWPAPTSWRARDVTARAPRACVRTCACKHERRASVGAGSVLGPSLRAGRGVLRFCALLFLGEPAPWSSGMQRGPLSPSPTDSPGALGTWYPGVHRGQGMAGLRVPAFNASLRPITPSHAETQPPETTSSGMHREPLSSTSVAHCESQCRETTGPGMPCAPQAERSEAAGVRGPRLVSRSVSRSVSSADPTPRELLWSSLPPTSPSTRKRRGRGRCPVPRSTICPGHVCPPNCNSHSAGPGAHERPPQGAPSHAQVLGPGEPAITTSEERGPGLPAMVVGVWTWPPGDGCRSVDLASRRWL
uniref:Uncharacterized protein n=1 Tax=Macaca fascicularis TaxID=9541 RepID=A0A7N9IGF6_MACFA